MTKEKKRRTKTKDLPKKERKLTAKELKKVRGGEIQASAADLFKITQDVTVNKAKTADKAFSAMDGYIKG